MAQGTFYGNNGWAGACAGLVPLTGQPWPPPGGTYQNNMQPGASTPINVAINSAQWSVPMVRMQFWPAHIRSARHWLLGLPML